jgi:hypothetical protein
VTTRSPPVVREVGEGDPRVIAISAVSSCPPPIQRPCSQAPWKSKPDLPAIGERKFRPLGLAGRPPELLRLKTNGLVLGGVARNPYARTNAGGLVAGEEDIRGRGAIAGQRSTGLGGSSKQSRLLPRARHSGFKPRAEFLGLQG